MKLRNLIPAATGFALAIGAVAQTAPAPSSAPAADVPLTRGLVND